MIVLKTGDKSTGILFQCKNCKGEFIAQRGEVKVTPPCIELQYYIKCPMCNEMVFSKKVLG